MGNKKRIEPGICSGLRGVLMKKIIVGLSALVLIVLLANPAYAQKKPNIGCESCHDESFSLFSQTQAVDDHPEEAPDGTELDDKTELPTCMECHAISIRTGKGVRAPKAMDAIVHPAHFFNNIFIKELGGNCYNCHVVGKLGNFEVVYKKIKTDDKGIPDKVPVDTLPSSYIGNYVIGSIVGMIVLVITLIISIIALVLAIKSRK